MQVRSGADNAEEFPRLLERLTLSDFRCFESLRWSIPPGPQLIVGDNGAGKTSVLEAVYFLATTKSFRTARPSDCRRWGASEFWVHGRTSGAELAAGYAGTTRRRQADGKNVSVARYLEFLPALSWSAADRDLLDGDPALRRRLLDQGVVGENPLAVEHLRDYRRVLAEKRELLKRGLAGSAGSNSFAGSGRKGPDGARSLEAWNDLLAISGFALIRLRQDYVTRLDQALRQVISDHELPLPAVALEYRPNLRSNLQTGRPQGSQDDSGPEQPPAVKVPESADEVRDALARARSREVDRRRILVGPHLDRLVLRWVETDIGKAASAGERKLFGLALTAARARVLAATGRVPVVLLDDLDAELDRSRLEIAWSLFSEMPQVLVSSAHRKVAKRLRNTASWCLESGLLAAL